MRVLVGCFDSGCRKAQFLLDVQVHSRSYLACPSVHGDLSASCHQTVFILCVAAAGGPESVSHVRVTRGRRRQLQGAVGKGMMAGLGDRQ